MRPHHPQGILQSDCLGIDQVAQQRPLAHRRDETIHHLVFRLAETAVEGLSRRHHLVADRADGLEQFGEEKLGGVI